MCRRLWKGVGVLVVATSALVFSPATRAGPPNDRYDKAQTIGHLPARVVGATEGARVDDGEPAPWCAAVRGVVWYRVRAPHRGPMVVRLRAGGELDAAVAVYRVVRSHRSRLRCVQTNEQGRAVVSWYAYPKPSYLIGVARRVGSAAAEFQLGVVAAERAARPPGEVLPARGVRATVDPILDAADVWAVQMSRGTTYRINLTAPSRMVWYELYRPGTYSFATVHPVRSDPNGGYRLFTPGITGGGVYSLVVRTQGDQPRARTYRLHVQAAGPDDIAPGIKIGNGETVSGTITSRGIDLVDLYRFNVPRPHALTTLRLQQKPTVGLDLMVLTEAGREVASTDGAKGRQVLREHLDVGSYFVALRSHERSGGRYQLQVQVRDITTTTVLAGGSRYLVAPATITIPITVNVTAANLGGRVVIEIDKHDPLSHWQFSSAITGRIGASGVLTLPWTPQSVGYWRVRARFPGTPYSSFSQSDYARIHVVEPLT
jgi:hypothetical protein